MDGGEERYIERERDMEKEREWIEVESERFL
jgi:hypothetical protein